MSDSVIQVRDIFDSWAREGRADRMADYHEHSARTAFTRLPLAETDWYLDIGCGVGYTVRWAAARVPRGRAIGLDVAPAMITRARALSDGFPNAEFLEATFPGADLPAGRFGGIFSMEVFYYLPDLDAALREVHRLLAPGGRFVNVVDFYEENAESRDWGDKLGVRLTRLSGAGWQDAFRRAGLDVEDQYRVRQEPGPDVARWQVEEGSLVTVGRRPTAGAEPAGS